MKIVATRKAKRTEAQELVEELQSTEIPSIMDFFKQQVVIAERVQTDFPEPTEIEYNITNEMDLDLYLKKLFDGVFNIPAVPVPPAFIPSKTRLEDHYYEFTIPKASGGLRHITAPDEELKIIQSNMKVVLQDYLKILAHDSAYAYVRHRSVRDALVVHQKNESRWFLKLDLKNFFNNCTTKFVLDKLCQLHPFAGMNDKLRDEWMDSIASMAFLNEALPQGTPLSPLLSNLVMVGFDKYMTAFAYQNQMRYTRYADDLTFTSRYDFKYDKVVKEVSRFLREEGYPFIINDKKTHYGSTSGSNWNLGMILNKENEITVGHKNKRTMKHMLFIFFKDPNVWVLEDVQILNGKLEWIKNIEPDYYKEMIDWFNKKHATDILGLIKVRLKGDQVLF